MAPEILNKQSYNAKVDIWALGVILFKMIFLRFPFSNLRVNNNILANIRKYTENREFDLIQLLKDLNISE